MATRPEPPRLDDAAASSSRVGLEAAAQLILAHDRFLITGHAHPDGDVIGSTLGLMHLLEALGKRAVAFNIDPVPFNLRFLPGAGRIQQTLPDDARFDVTCLLDCAARARVGARFPSRGWGERLLVIDHHKNPPRIGDVVLHDGGAAATSVLIFALARHMGVPLNGALAECLYCALVADTGGFRYSSTSARALQIASELVAAGVDVWRVTSHFYESNPVERVQLLGHVLRTLELSPCGRLAILRVSRVTLRRLGANEAMLDGFINHARSIRGVEIAAQLREVGNRRYRISFRSRGRVDVSLLAERFGGGGHRNAAGCHIDGSWGEVRDHLFEALQLLLGAAGSR